MVMPIRDCFRCGVPLYQAGRFCPACGAPQVWDTPAAPVPVRSAPPAADPPPAAAAPGEVAETKPGVNVVGILVAAGLAAAAAQHPKGRLLFVLAAVAIPTHLAHLLTFVVLGVAWRRKIDEFGLFYGWRLLAFRAAGCLVRINALPMGGYVKFHGWEETPAAIPAASSADDPYAEQSYYRLRPWQKIVLNLSGPFAAMALAAAALGPAAALGEFLEAFAQYVEGALAPRTRGRELVAGYARLLEERQYVIAFGVLAAKMSAGNLWPVPITNGGLALFELLAWVRGAPLQPRTSAMLQYATMLVMVALTVGWVIAIVAYARSG